VSARPIIDAGPGLNFLSANKERLLIAVLLNSVRGRRASAVAHDPAVLKPPVARRTHWPMPRRARISVSPQRRVADPRSLSLIAFVMAGRCEEAR
jgi:hypothetical protein